MADREYINNCFEYFPRFFDDYAGLAEAGIIKPVGDYCEWTASKTSLGQYFKWIAGNEKYRIPGGFWHPVETVFLIKGKPIERGSLSHNASSNGNNAKKKTSKDFDKIKNIVESYREELRRQEAVIECFQEIKNIVASAKGEGFNESDRALKKIMKAMKDFVSKNE
jgi:uncharacterized protein (UPF0335 family)